MAVQVPPGPGAAPQTNVMSLGTSCPSTDPVPGGPAPNSLP